jgi:hypothetical protein
MCPLGYELYTYYKDAVCFGRLKSSFYLNVSIYRQLSHVSNLHSQSCENLRAHVFIIFGIPFERKKNNVTHSPRTYLLLYRY